MSNLKLRCRILRLKALKITDFCFKCRDKELHLAVKPYKNGRRCPQCGRRGKIAHQTGKPRRWDDLAVFGLTVHFWYAPKEVHCEAHGRAQEALPWAAPRSRITDRLAWRICVLCQQTGEHRTIATTRSAPLPSPEG